MHHDDKAHHDAKGKELLRPDDELYDFNTFFWYNFSKHEIEPHPRANSKQKIQAEITIQIFGLNDLRNTKGRKKSYENYKLNKMHKPEEFDIDDCSHRFILF